MGNINWLFMFPTILVETKSSVRMAATPCKLMYDFTPALVLPLLLGLLNGSGGRVGKSPGRSLMTSKTKPTPSNRH